MLQRHYWLGCKRRGQIPIETDTDSRGLVDASQNLAAQSSLQKRRATDLADIKEAERLNLTRPLTFIGGKTNPMDNLTKRNPDAPWTIVQLMVTGRYAAWYSKDSSEQEWQRQKKQFGSCGKRQVWPVFLGERRLGARRGTAQ